MKQGEPQNTKSG